MQPLACDLWLMERNSLRNFLTLSALVRKPTEDEISAAAVASSARQQKSIAIIPIVGPIEARPSFFGSMLGMTSYQAISQSVMKYGADGSVSHIILDFATPGGMVYGCPECAAVIRSVAQRKPVIAMINPMAASAGYWMASAATRIVMTESGDTGSVGVIAEHVDISKALEANGETVTVIRSTASPYKQEANQAEVLTDEAKANIQARVDDIYARFSGDVAAFRGVDVSVVNAKFGQGRLVDAKTAKSVGMIDQIMTMDQLIAKIIEGRVRLGGTSACDDWNALTPREQRLERVAALEKVSEMAIEPREPAKA